jgi:hypothetical protein
MSIAGGGVTRDAKVFLATFTILLAVVPMATLFLVRDVIAPRFELAPGLTDGLAIIAAVISVQLILVWSCVQGFKPESDEMHEKTT